MADTLLRLCLISAALVDAQNAVIGLQASAPQLLPVRLCVRARVCLINTNSVINIRHVRQISAAELNRVVHGTAASVTHACGRSGTAAFNAIAGDDILSRCGISFEAFSIMVDVQAFFAGDEHALEVELWGLWQVRVPVYFAKRI